MTPEEKRLAITVANMNRMFRKISSDDDSEVEPLSKLEASVGYMLRCLRQWNFSKKEDKFFTVEVQEKINTLLPSMFDHEKVEWSTYDSKVDYSAEEYLQHFCDHIIFSTNWNEYHAGTRMFIQQTAGRMGSTSIHSFYHFFSIGETTRQGVQSVSTSWGSSFTALKMRNTMFENKTRTTQRDIILRNNHNHEKIRADTKRLFDDLYDKAGIQGVGAFDTLSRKANADKPPILFHMTAFHPAIIEGALESKAHAMIGNLTGAEELRLYDEALQKVNPEAGKAFSVIHKNEDNMTEKLCHIMNKHLVRSSVTYPIQTRIYQNNSIWLENVLRLDSSFEKRVLLKAYTELVTDGLDYLCSYAYMKEPVLAANIALNPAFSEWRDLPDIITNVIWDSFSEVMLKWYIYEGAENEYRMDLATLNRMYEN